MTPERKKIDDLAGQVGGYFSPPSEDSMAYTELLFDICQQFGIHYYTVDQERALFRGGSDPCHLGKTAGGENRYSAEYPSRIFCSPRILTHAGNLLQNNRAIQQERSSPLVALCFFQGVLLLLPAVQNIAILMPSKIDPHRC